MDYKYDPDADLLAITLSKTPFDYAHQTGDFIVHFDKNDQPVYVEILNAQRFMSKSASVLTPTAKKGLLWHIQTA